MANRSNLGRIGIALIVFGLTLFLVVMLGCSNPAEPEVQRPTITLTLSVSGDKQVGRVAEALPSPVVVRVQARNSLTGLSSPAVGQLVNWVVSDGGSTFALVTTTNDLGEARNLWTLGTKAGAQSLEARAIDDAGQPVVFQRVEATAEPGPIHYLDMPPIDQLLDGDMLVVSRYIVSAMDEYRNPITTYPELGVSFWPLGGEMGAVEQHGDVFTLSKDLLGSIPFEGKLVLWQYGKVVSSNTTLIVNPRPTL